jgi:uncharacterized protein (TIGR03437 family)
MSINHISRNPPALRIVTRALALFLPVFVAPCVAEIVDQAVFNGNTYYLLSNNDFQTLENEAVSLGGHLTSVNSQDEQDFIWNQWGGEEQALCIGFTDEAEEGTFVWVSGEPVVYTNWSPGEPNNFMGIEHFTVMAGFQDPNGRWNDIPDCGLAVAQVPGLPKPVVGSGAVLNAASYIPSGLPGEGIAQGSMFVVFGRNLGPDELVFPGAVPLPTEMDGTSIQVSVDGVIADAHMVYTSANQLAAVLPSTVPTGQGTFTVTYNGETGPPAPILVVPHAFGIFTRNTAGFGPAIVQNWISHTEPPHLNAFTDASQPGQIEIIWGTGLGAISGDDAGPPPVGNLDVDVEVLVGGKSAKLHYKGRSAQFPGIDQVQFEVPADVEGCHVPVAVKAGGVIANHASMAIAANGGVCSSPTSFAAADLQRAAQGQETNFGGILLLRLDLAAPSSPDEFRFEDVSADFVRLNANALLASLLPVGSHLSVLPPSLGACTVEKTADNELGSLEDPVFEALVVRGELDAGPMLNLTGPLGMLQVGGGGGEDYSMGIEDPFVEPGQYTLDNGGGGADIGSFQAALTIPDSQFTWTNKQSIQTVRRTEDLTVTWSGGDPDKEFVAIVGWSAWDRDGGDVVSVFVCAERPSAGSFTVPAWVLANLPVSSVSEGEDLFDDAYSGLIVATMPILDLNKFAAPGLDVSLFYYLVGNWWLVPVE